MLHQHGRHFGRAVAEGSEVGVLDLDQIRPAREFRDQGPQAARLMLANLRRESLILGRVLVLIQDVDFAENFVELLECDCLPLLANGRQREIHAIAKRPAEVVDADGASVTEWERQEGRDHQHSETARGRVARARSTRQERDVTA